MNSTVLVCEAPAVPAGTTTVNYTLRLDNAPFPNTTSSSSLALEAVPDPVVTDFRPKSIHRNSLSYTELIILVSKNCIIECSCYTFTLPFAHKIIVMKDKYNFLNIIKSTFILNTIF